VGRTPNICAGPFGAVYDFYIERPWLSRLIGRTLWGIDTSVLYDSTGQLTSLTEGSTVLDVPCGGGVAFRAVPSGRELRYVAIDIDKRMLSRARRRAARRGLAQVEVLAGDMLALPLDNGEADLVLSYSGLHMVSDPQRAVRELSRCLKPDGRLLGTTFLAGGSRRTRALLGLSARRGHPWPPAREDLLRWLTDAGIADAYVGSQPGFAVFGGRRDRRRTESPLDPDEKSGVGRGGQTRCASSSDWIEHPPTESARPQSSG
jgi:SAM-dependent methyltransferase